MKRILILVAAVCCTLPMAAQWGRRPTPNDTLQSTRVLPDGKVLFQIYAPEAKMVSVGGDLPWDKPVKFEKADNGVWKGVCEGLGDGVFRYNFTVDGVRVQDPKAPLSAEQSSLLQVGDKPAASGAESSAGLSPPLQGASSRVLPPGSSESSVL